MVKINSLIVSILTALLMVVGLAFHAPSVHAQEVIDPSSTGTVSSGGVTV